MLQRAIAQRLFKFHARVDVPEETDYWCGLRWGSRRRRNSPLRSDEAVSDVLWKNVQFVKVR